jgi:hypothetical protein
MNYIKPEDIILKESIALYNNLANTGSSRGRLSSELEIYPSPRINWEYEALGNRIREPDTLDTVLIHPLVGKRFTIEHPYISNQGWSTLSRPSSLVFKGYAPQAMSGDLNFLGDGFQFYIPNARFQQINLIGQIPLVKVSRYTKDGVTHDTREGSEGRFVVEPLDDDWEVLFETRQNALEWLDPLQSNIGTLITTFGCLRKRKKGRPKLQIHFLDAINSIHSLCLLLSFANGGYLNPLYILGYQTGKKLKFATIVLASKTTPLELLGNTWLTIESDLPAFIRCFSAFEKMGGLNYWSEGFDLILSWYFQAIQPQSNRVGKPWPIIANALGAALERLSNIILENELDVKGLKDLSDRIEHLLEIIGITQARGYNDINSIKDFIKIRNNATHPQVKGRYTHPQISQILWRAMQWVEEILLWRLGYSGKYQERSQPYPTSINNRYNLGTRDPNW